MECARGEGDKEEGKEGEEDRKGRMIYTKHKVTSVIVDGRVGEDAVT